MIFSNPRINLALKGNYLKLNEYFDEVNTKIYKLGLKILTMIKFQDIKTGDYVLAEYDGKTTQGEVTNLNRDEKEICVNNGVQNFWFKADQLKPLPLDDEQLKKLNFQKQNNDDGTVKYLKGAFRILLFNADDFSKFEIWYRDERRHILHPIGVHDLQNHYLDMTKVHLTDEAF